MLGKLFKYEFKNTAKVMLLIYGMFAAITLLGTFVLSWDSVQKEESAALNFMLTALIVFYILSVFALFIVTYVYMCLHFYKTMYSGQGYLTHTLPVKSSTLFHVKLATSMVWMVCSMALLILSIFLFVLSASHGEIFSSGLSAELHQVSLEFEQELGMSLGTFCVHAGFSVLLSCLSYLLWIFTSASVGQLFSQYKVVAAIVTGVVLYFVEQIASLIIMFTTGYTASMNETTVSITGINAVPAGSGADSVFPALLGNTYIWSILLCLVYYIVCRVIIQKHLNLE